MIKPINGLETANPSEIASLNGSKSRLRMRGRAFATGKSVARPAPKALGVSAATSRTLIVFMLSSYRWQSNRGYCACVGFCNTTL